MRLLLALALVLATFQHLTATHADAHGLVAEAAGTVVATEAVESAGVHEHANDVCHAADGCPIFLPFNTFTVPAPIAEAGPPMLDAFAVSALRPPLRHPPKPPMMA